jgi:uncharacterized protein YbaP (TraB family)
VETPLRRGPFSHGVLWEIKPPGAPASYLFGTIHLAGLTRLPPAVALALVKADAFIAETVLDSSAMAYYQRQMFAEQPPNIGSMFNGPFRARLLRLLATYGFDEETASHLRPWAAFTLLGRPKPTGAPTLDQTLEAMARQRGKPVRGLETVQELVAALDDIPLDHQREIVVDTVCNRALLEEQTRELTDRYLDQDLTGMLSVSRKYEPRDKAIARTFKETLLDDRNQKMLARLEPFIEQGNAFAAVGVLHLPGKEGLLRGLAARGYKIRSIF